MGQCERCGSVSRPHECEEWKVWLDSDGAEYGRNVWAVLAEDAAFAFLRVEEKLDDGSYIVCVLSVERKGAEVRDFMIEIRTTRTYKIID